MGIFDNREKELEARAGALESQVAEASKGAASSDARARDLQQKLIEREADISRLQEALNDRRDIPSGTLSAIRLFVRLLGVALVIASLAFARSLARGALAETPYLTVWGLYLFSQFAGLYLTGFGAPTALRAITIFGVYMSALFVFIAVVIVLSLFGQVSLPLTHEIVWLAVVNALGVPTLIYVEKRTHAKSLTASDA